MIQTIKHIPYSWNNNNLGDIVIVKKGEQLNKLTLRKSGKYYVQNGGIEPSGYTDKYNTAENTITISEGGNSCGFIKFNETKFWAGGHCYFLTNISNKLDKNFLYYQLKANEKRIMALRVGSGLPNIQKKDINDFQIIYPSLKAQKKIVEILSAWDEAIEKLDKLISAKEQQFKWLLKKLITDQRDKPDWKKVKLGDIVTMGKGKQLNKLTLQKSGKYYVQNGGIEPSGYTDEYNTAKNTITISEGGNSCGFVKFNETRFWAGGHCYFLANLSNKLDKKFLYYQLKANEKRIMRLRVGSGLPNIQKKDINDFQIVYPPLKEQKKIVKTLSTKNQELETLKQLYKKYEEQKQGLMQKLLTRKWRIET